MKCATGMNTVTAAMPQQMPSAESTRVMRSEGVWRSTRAVAGTGALPNTLIVAGKS